MNKSQTILNIKINKVLVSEIFHFFMISFNNNYIFLGDIKHYFAFHRGERNLFLDLMQEIEKHIKRENIIVIKGNHEKMENLADKHFLDFYIEKDLAFIHGDEPIKQTFSK